MNKELKNLIDHPGEVLLLLAFALELFAVFTGVPKTPDEEQLKNTLIQGGFATGIIGILLALAKRNRSS